jgi:hypothetical protein
MERRLLIPSLGSLGQESGFTIATERCSCLRVRTYHAGRVVDVREFPLSGQPALTRRWREDWTSLPVAADELFTLECEGEDPSNALEGELLFRTAARTQQVAVLTNFVPCRPAGFKFGPILHQAHYNVIDDTCETYVVHANLVGEHEDPAGINRLQIEVRDFAARVLAVEQRELGFNTTWLLPVRSFARSLGAPLDGGVTLRLRGGSSQFAIFTAYHRPASASIGIEHSLPPIYFTEAPTNPALRARYLASAFGDLQRS